MKTGDLVRILEDWLINRVDLFTDKYSTRLNTVQLYIDNEFVSRIYRGVLQIFLIRLYTLSQLSRKTWIGEDVILMYEGLAVHNLWGDDKNYYGRID